MAGSGGSARNKDTQNGFQQTKHVKRRFVVFVIDLGLFVGVVNVLVFHILGRLSVG